MATERVFGQALLESDFVNPNFFFMLAKEDKKAIRSCRVLIPPTALFEQGFAKALFTTEILRQSPEGEVKKKVGRDVDSDEVYDVMTKGIHDDKQMCAVQLYAAPRSSELTRVRFLDKAGVHQFIYHELEKPKSILQRFVTPKGTNNNLIIATWSPLLVLAEGRRSTFTLEDRLVNPNRRGVTFEDPSANSVVVTIADSVVAEITKICATVATHFDKTEKLNLHRMTAAFKVDAQNRVLLLYSTSLRFHDAVMSTQHPVSLDSVVRVEVPILRSPAPLIADVERNGGAPSSEVITHLKTVSNQAMALQAKSSTSHTQSYQNALDDTIECLLGDAEKKQKHMRISIPAVGNTGALLFDSVRGRSVSTNHNGGGAKQKSSRGSMSPKGSPTGSQCQSPTRSLVNSPLGSPKHNKPGCSFDSPAAMSKAKAPHDSSPSLAGRNNPHQSHIPSQQRGASGNPSPASPATPVTSLEGQFLTVAPGAPLPQPRPLLKYQHLLPNSVGNMNQAVQLHALGTDEDALRAEWNQFLLAQEKDIRKLRIAQAGKKLQQNSSSGGGGEGGAAPGGGGLNSNDLTGSNDQDRPTSNGDAAKLPGGGLLPHKAPPQAKHHAVFDMPGSPNALHSATVPPRMTILGQENIKQMTAAASVTLKAAQDKAAQRERNIFMEETKNAVAMKALGGVASVRGGAGANGGGEGAGGNDAVAVLSEVSQEPLEDDPRFPYVSRETKLFVQVPDGVGVQRSTLLPPVFQGNAANGGAGGSSGTRSLTRMPSTRTPNKQQQQQPNNKAPASPTAKVNSSSDVKQQATNGATMQPPSRSAQRSPAKAMPSGVTSSSPSAAAAASPMKGGGGGAVAASGGSSPAPLTVSPSLVPASPNKRRLSFTGPTSSSGGASPVPNALPSHGGLSPSALFDSGADVASGYFGSPLSSPAGSKRKTYLEQSLDRRARVLHMYNDFSALEDEADVALVRRRARALCDKVASYVAELHYSVHGVYVTKSAPVAYVEIPVMLRSVLHIPTLAAMLHKLHPRVLPRERFLLEASQGDIAVALKLRQEYLAALSNVSLGEFSCESIPLPSSAAANVDNANSNSSAASAAAAAWESLWNQKIASPTQRANSGGGTDSKVHDATTRDDHSYCLVIPLLESSTRAAKYSPAVGFAILREESLAVQEEVKPYLDETNGIVCHFALQHCYFERIKELKGDQAAERERLQHEAEERERMMALQQQFSEGEEGTAGRTPTHMDYNAVANSFDSDEGGVPKRSALDLKPASRHGLTPLSSGRYAPSSGNPSMAAKAATTTPPPPAAIPLDAAAAKKRQVDDMMCPRCLTCRVCCVCDTVFGGRKKKN